MLKKSFFISLGLLVLVTGLVFGQNRFRVDANGNITLNGQPFRVKGGSWFGLEGRHEVPDDLLNPSGALMEQYMGNLWWQESGRTYDQDIQEFKQMGFNVIRLPLAPQTLDGNNPQGREPFLKNAPSVRIANARLALETIIRKLDAAGMFVVLDIHSCSNYVGWRAGRLDARPPYIDNSWDYYDYMRDDCSCAATANPQSVSRIQPYDMEKWLSDLRTLAGFASSLDVDNIMGIDIFNEPWDYSWADWKSLIDQAYSAINTVNQDILIFAQGIGFTNGNQDGTPSTVNQTPHGDAGLPNWGENLFEAGNNPPTMPRDRLVFSPHCYGPSKRVQPMFADPSQPGCANLREDAFGDAQCQIVIDPARLEPSWEEHFGYLKDLGYAVCIGEFGGNPDWPKMAEYRIQNRYRYITDLTPDWQWQNAFVNYLVKKGIYDTIYWAINPESLDTGGIYTHAYNPTSNTAGWGTWETPDQRKLDLLAKLWFGPPTPTPPPGRRGDANDNGTVEITDALIIAQKSAGMSPDPFSLSQADANCDGIVDINDALIIARYTAGLMAHPYCL